MPLREDYSAGLEGDDLQQAIEPAGIGAERHAASAAHNGRTQEPEPSRYEPGQQPSVSPDQQPSLGTLESETYGGTAQNQPSPVPRNSEPSIEAASGLPAATVIRAPRGLRSAGTDREHQSAVARAIEQTLATLAPRATAASTVNAPPRAEPPIRLQRKPAAGPAATVASDVVQAPAADAAVAQIEVPASHGPADVEHIAASAAPPNLPASRENREPQSRQRAREMESLPGLWALFEREPGEMHGLEFSAKPPQGATRPALPVASDSRRRSQISIGRVDVQVNNVPPVAEPAPRPAGTSAYSNFLEARYLNRFSLKPW
jgi:hypothetical protein